MTYALNLGISHGFVRSLPAIIAQMLGVIFVSIACIFGIASVLMAYPNAMTIIKILGGIYILYLGIKLLKNSGKFEVQKSKIDGNLFFQGFVISTTNPKAWIFFGAIYPQFINTNEIFGFYNLGLVLTMGLSEITSLSIYTTGGVILKKLLKTHLRYLELFCAILMCAIGILMIFR